MRLLLLTTALTGLTLAPAAAQDRDGDRRGVSPQEYFGDRDDRDDRRSQDPDRQRGDSTVTVTITGVEPDGGELYVALQDETGFAQKGGNYTQTVDADGRSVRVTFDGVAAGEYAVAAFQDTDGDGDVRITSTGPAEPWGVSGGTPRRSAPSFDDAMIRVDGDTRARLRLVDGAAGGDMQNQRTARSEREDDDAAARGTERRAQARRRAAADAERTAGDRGAMAGGGMTAADRVMEADNQRDDRDDRDSQERMADRMRRGSGGGDSTVTVTLTGVEPDGGEVYVALQEPGGFAARDGAYTQTADADGRAVTVTFNGVEPGEYAVAAFQDTNGDGDLTLERTGPTEPWGFSGRVMRDQAPRFDDASVRVDGRTRTRVRLAGGADMPMPGERRAAMRSRDDDKDMDMDRDMDRRMTTSADRRMDRGMTRMDDRDARGGSALVYRRSAALAPDALTARDYLGAELTDQDGDEVADIEDVILDARGQAVGIVLATGGLFGLGEDYYAVTFDRVRPVREADGVRLVSQLSEADVERLREFDLDGFKENMGERRLASDLAGADVTLGSGRERARVDDVVMSTRGVVEAVVLEYDGGRYIVSFGDLTRSGDGYALAADAGDISTLTRFEGRQGERRTVRERVLGDRR